MKSKVKHLIAFLVVSIAALCCLPSSADAQYYVVLGDRCFTPYQRCWLDSPAPVGSQCYCFSAFYGATYGFVR